MFYISRNTCICLVLSPADGKGASSAQVSSHQQQKAERDRWRADCDGLQDVLFNLERTYQTHKGDFALGRYEELKDMVKSAVSQSQAIVQVSSPIVSRQQYPLVAHSWRWRTRTPRRCTWCTGLWYTVTRLYSEGPIFRRATSPKGHWSEGPLVRIVSFFRD